MIAPLLFTADHAWAYCAGNTAACVLCLTLHFLTLPIQVMVYSSANQENHGLLSPDELNKLRHQRQELCEVRRVKAAVCGCILSSHMRVCLLVCLYGEIAVKCDCRLAPSGVHHIVPPALPNSCRLSTCCSPSWRTWWQRLLTRLLHSHRMNHIVLLPRTQYSKRG